MTIVAHLRCQDCAEPFGLTGRQRNSGLLAQRTRCGPCRAARRRQLAAIRAQHFRLRRRNAGSALSHASTGQRPASGDLRWAS